jgi:Protein of unknown function (DUF1064)
MPRNRRWTEADIARLTGTRVTREARPRKFRNIPTTVEGVNHGSRKEARRAQDLRLMAAAGLITDLVLEKRHLRYPLIVNGQRIGTYTADARYRENGQLVVEDTKSEATRRTPWWRRTRKLMRAMYGITILET